MGQVYSNSSDEHAAVRFDTSVPCPWNSSPEVCTGRVRVTTDMDQGETVIGKCEKCARVVLVTVDLTLTIDVASVDPDGPPVTERGECEDRWHTRDAKLPPGEGDRRCPACHDDGDRTMDLFAPASVDAS